MERWKGMELLCLVSYFVFIARIVSALSSSIVEGANAAPMHHGEAGILYAQLDGRGESSFYSILTLNSHLGQCALSRSEETRL
ncbi:hypothetical protein C8R45DRAFT_1023122 [Mycena sanguinolenta]|nr:hypothetical protein C8R45DRAFT_1023122 [Mycena sanguinolenta]